MASLKQGNLGDVLRGALQKLHQEEHFDKYLKYLNSEWYYTADDLRLARNDEKVWAEIKFPGRLKIEIAALLDAAATVPEPDQQPSPDHEREAITAPITDETNAAQDEGEHATWVKCWAPEHECYYFYNMVTQESSWEDPQAGYNIVYDVYQYNDETQQWEVIEDNTSAAGLPSHPSNPFSLGEESPVYSPLVSSAPKSIFAAESKWSEEKQSADNKVSPRTAAIFTRPRVTPRNDSEDRLFVESPNRPKFTKGHRSPERDNDYKRNYKYSANKRNSPVRNTPPTGGKSNSADHSGSGPSSGPGSGPGGSLLARRGKARGRPVRLDMCELSSGSDSDTANGGTNSPVQRNMRTNKPQARPAAAADDGAGQKESVSPRSEAKPARVHSPMMSKPVGRPAGAARSPQRSPKRGGVSVIGAEAKELPANGARSYDWDSKHNDSMDRTTEHDTAQAVDNNNPNTAAVADEEPYDYYRDYANTEAEYDASQHSEAVDRDVDYVVNNQLGAYIDAPGAEYNSDNQYGGYNEQEGAYEYDEDGNYYTAYDESSKTYYDYAADGTGADYKDSDYEYPDEGYYDYSNGVAYDGTGEEPYDTEQYGADDSYALEYSGEGYGNEGNGNNNGHHSTKAKTHGGIAEEEQAYENSFYNHLSVPSAPPGDDDANTTTNLSPIPAFSPRSQGAAGPKSELHGPNSARFAGYKTDTPGTRTPPPLSPPQSPIATPVHDNGATGDEFYIVEATAEAMEEGQGDLMALAMGSPATPGDTPEQQAPKAKQRSTISKLFRMNLFGKGPSLPSTPPPPRDPSSGLDPHSSAYRHQKMLERKASKKNVSQNSFSGGISGSDNTSGKTSGKTSSSSAISSAAILNADAVTAHSSYGGNLNNANLRRKPAPAPPDSANAVNARQKFYSAHAQQHHYKYHDRITSLENRGSGSFASKAEELHYRNLQKLLDMGFDEHESIMALSMCDDDLNDASQMLLEARDR